MENCVQSVNTHVLKSFTYPYKHYEHKSEPILNVLQLIGIQNLLLFLSSIKPFLHVMHVSVLSL